ncbi:MAG: D-glucuronyl C5-epimerase family protein [Thermoleophilia bacterium]
MTHPTPSIRHRPAPLRRAIRTAAAAAAMVCACAGVAAAAVPTDGTDVRTTKPPPTFHLDTLPSFLDSEPGLLNRWATAKPGTQTAKDLTWLVRADQIVHSRPTPLGRKKTIERVVRVNAWWYATHDSPSAHVILYGDDGILFNYRKGFGFEFNPVATAGRWRKLNAKVPVQDLAKAMLQFAVQRRYAGQPWMAYEYYDDRDRPLKFVPGTSGMAQSRMATLFASSWVKTGNPRYATMASRLIQFFSVPTSAGGGKAMLINPVTKKKMLWYPERVFPGDDPWKGAALNGFMAALIDLYAAATRLGMPVETGKHPSHALKQAVADERRRALKLAEQGAVSVSNALPFHDTGSWSLYALHAAGYNSGPLKADLNYHCYHIALLHSLERRAPGLGFETYARKWQGYVNKRGLKCPARPNSGDTSGDASTTLPPDADPPPGLITLPPDTPPTP